MTIQKKGPAIGSQPTESQIQNRRRNSTKFTPRLHRLAYALLAGPRSVRELMEILPSNNSPEYVRQLRARLGVEIPCEYVPFSTIDSMPSRYGIYHLTHTDRQQILNALRQEDEAKCHDV